MNTHRDLKKRVGIFSLITPLVFLFMSPMALAADEAPAALSEWKGAAEIGAVASSGNTEAKTLKTRFKLENERKRWRSNAKLDSYYVDSYDGSGGDAQKLAFSGYTAYKLSSQNYTYATAGYENDRFSGYKYRIHESVGVGRTIIRSDELLLNIEAGPGGRHSLLEETDEYTDELVGIGALEFNWQISERTSFSEDLTTTSGEEDTVVESTTALKTNINGSSLSMKISLDVKWNSNPPTDKKNTDTITSVTLSYDF